MSSICYYSMFVFQSTYILCLSSNLLIYFCSSSNLLIFFVRLPIYLYFLFVFQCSRTFYVGPFCLSQTTHADIFVCTFLCNLHACLTAIKKHKKWDNNQICLCERNHVNLRSFVCRTFTIYNRIFLC